MLIVQCGYLLLSVFIILSFCLYLVNTCAPAYICMRIHFYVYTCAHIPMNINIHDALTSMYGLELGMIITPRGIFFALVMYVMLVRSL